MTLRPIFLIILLILAAQPLSKLRHPYVGVWNANAENDSMTLIGRWNYHNELAAQFTLASRRVVYSKAGMQPTACVLRDATYAIDHKLYWSAPVNEVEAYYLTGLLNSETARQRGESLQSRGQWGARDFDKVMFNLPIPRFDADNPLHNDIAEAARKAETAPVWQSLARCYRTLISFLPAFRDGRFRPKSANRLTIDKPLPFIIRNPYRLLALQPRPSIEIGRRHGY